jgi:two-component system, response regulator YesN
MYSVLIVDDEPIITEGLSILLDWKEFGFSNLETASDGEEALKKLKSKKFHLIVTDIRMPGLSGLQLIQSIKANSLNTKIIIISGYSDFSYARESIQYGVKDYILKPISKDEIVKAVTDIKAELDSELKELKITNSKNHLIKDKLLTDIVNGNYSSIDEIESGMLSTLNFKKPNFCSCLIKVTNLQRLTEENPEEGELIKFGIRNVIEEIFEGSGSGYVYEDIDNLFGIILIPNDTDDFEAKLNDVFNTAFSYIKKIFNKSSIAAVGSVVDNLYKLKLSRSQALYAMDRRYMLSNKSIIPYYKISTAENRTLRMEWNNSNLLSSVEEMDFSAIKEQIYALKEAIIEKKLGKEIITGIVFNTIFGLQNILEKNGEDQSNSINVKEISHSLNCYEDIESLSNWLEDLCVNVSNRIIELSSSKSPHLIEDVISYIDRNYHQDLSLKNISNEFFLNSAYLGRIFKTATGESFNDYINMKRISEAKKLYAGSNMKINKILDKVGYKNPEYFYRLFKKYEGITFSEYSENIKDARKRLMQ